MPHVRASAFRGCPGLASRGLAPLSPAEAGAQCLEAVLAQHHDIPFYIAAPSTTFDLSTPDGSGIPIEERSAEEIRNGFGRPTAPEQVGFYCPAFDVTPANLIQGIITERGLIQPVNREQVAAMVG